MATCSLARVWTGASGSLHPVLVPKQSRVAYTQRALGHWDRGGRPSRGSGTGWQCGSLERKGPTNRGRLEGPEARGLGSQIYSSGSSILGGAWGVDLGDWGRWDTMVQGQRTGTGPSWGSDDREAGRGSSVACSVQRGTVYMSREAGAHRTHRTACRMPGVAEDASMMQGGTSSLLAPPAEDLQS